MLSDVIVCQVSYTDMIFVKMFALADTLDRSYFTRKSVTCDILNLATKVEEHVPIFVSIKHAQVTSLCK